MSNKFEKIVAQISSKVFEREEEVGILLTTIIAGYNAVMIGNAGTAKSMLATEVLKHFAGQKYHSLLHPFSEPSDLLGELDLRAMKHGRRIRNTANTLVEADYAFLDEIFKARSTTLTALLQLLNERIYVEEGTAREIPLKGVIGASNEFCDDESGAIADRFRVYLPIFNLGEKLSRSINRLWQDHEEYEREMIEAPFINVCRKKSKKILKKQGSSIFSCLIEINKKFVEQGASELSDRSLIQCCEMIAMSAVLSKRSEVSLSDYNVVKYMAKDFDIDAPIYNQVINDFASSNVIIDALEANIRKAKSKSSLAKLLNDLDNKSLPFYMTIRVKKSIKIKLDTLG
jgi:MoxR-like ATPase